MTGTKQVEKGIPTANQPTAINRTEFVIELQTTDSGVLGTVILDKGKHGVLYLSA